MQVKSKYCFNKGDPSLPGKIHININNNYNYEWYDKETNEFKIKRSLISRFFDTKRSRKIMHPMLSFKVHNNNPPSVCDLSNLSGTFVNSNDKQETPEKQIKKKKEKRS